MEKREKLFLEKAYLITEKEFDELLKNQKVSVQSVKYVVQDEQYKALYPDMLQAIIVNNGSDDIKSAKVSFVAWDKNNLPVKIKGNIDFSNGAYIRGVDYSDINLVPGDEFGRNSGFSIDENCAIESFKAIVKSYETFEGTTWANPYYDAWISMYEGVKYTDELTVTLEIVEEDNITEEIITTIFTPGTACHDGGMIIRSNKIICAGAYYPSTDQYDVPKSLGTRHRAAIGISERYDAFTIIVSEETGNISVTISGHIDTAISLDRLREVLDRYLLNK